MKKNILGNLLIVALITVSICINQAQAQLIGGASSASQPQLNQQKILHTVEESAFYLATFNNGQVQFSIKPDAHQNLAALKSFLPGNEAKTELINCIRSGYPFQCERTFENGITVAVALNGQAPSPAGLSFKLKITRVISSL